MLKTGDTLTSTTVARNLRAIFASQFLILAVLLALFAPQQRALGMDDPFSAPLKSLNKIDPAHVVQFRLVELTSNPKGATAIIELDTRAGFKVYEKGLKFEYKSSSTLNVPIALQVTSDPPAKVVQDPFYNEPRGVFEKGARFNASGDIPMEETGVVRIRFEACSVNTCLLPTYFTIAASKGNVSSQEPRTNGITSSPSLSQSSPLESSTNLPGKQEPDPFSAAKPATAQAPSSQPTASSTPTPALTASPISTPQPKPSIVLEKQEKSLTDTVTAEVQKALGKGSWFLFPALFLAGLLMNLTPCVYPMIPITLNVLGHANKQDQKSGDDTPHPFVPALIYVAGIIIAYAGMGVIAGMTGSLFGGLLQSKAFNFALACLMFALGLSMLGTIDLSRIQNFANKIPLSKQSPRLAVFTMGTVSGLVAAPCTGPVLSLLLVLVGQTKDPVYGFTLMSVFAAGFGAPYLVLGMLSHQFKRLPKAGRLMNLVKNLFAAMMFALALYYLKPLIGNLGLVSIIYAEPSLTGIITIAALTVVFMSWQNRSAQHPITVMGTQIGFTLLALWMTLAAIKGFIPMQMPLWPSFNRIGDPVDLPKASTQSEGQVTWYKEWNKAVQAARLERKGLVVDAWAQWCAACLKMDAEVWSESGVATLINQHFIALKVDFTESNPGSEELTKKWDLSGLPAVGIYPADSDFEGQPPILFREAVTVIQFHQAVQKLFNGDIAPR